MMKCKKKRCLWTILVALLIVLCTGCSCKHQETYTKIVKEATCCELGQIDTICVKCDTVLASNPREKCAHTFGDYELTIKPSSLGPGLEVRVCSSCLKEEKREYFCSHEVNPEEKWTYAKYATPFESGERYKHCYLCEAVLSETYTIPELEGNSIYITGTDIKHTFTISSFTQNAVDRYDIVYTEGSKLGSNNPFVLGHNYGSLGILYQTKVGEHIYLYINGAIEVYEVIASEYALQNSTQNDIIGPITGTSIWHSYECKTLHLYTCYGNGRNGRWIVLAKQIF